MENSFLINKPKKIRTEERKDNINNGNDAELLAASLSIMAMGGEISWGSRNEDGRKIDLICSFDHPWIIKERVVFFIQVKSGDTYGQEFSDPHSGFRLKKPAIDGALRTSHAICVIWINRKNETAFWAYVHPQTKKYNYGKNHLLTPAMRFDIARCLAYNLPINKGVKGIIISEKQEDFKKLREKALKKYKTFKEGGILSPVLGHIELTRIGWRHMFRKSRSTINKNKSFNTIMHIDSILSNLPTSIYISECQQTSDKDEDKYEYRLMEYILIYDPIKIQKKNNKLEDAKIVVRVREEIRWPANWRNNSTLTQFIDRRVVLLNCYYK